MYVFLRFFTFFSKSKKTWLFTFFWVVVHVFSNAGLDPHIAAATADVVLFISCWKECKKDGYRQWNVRQFLHILTSMGIRPWDNRSKCKCYMDGKRIQYLSNATHRSMYPSIFNRFSVIQPEGSKFTQTSKFSSTYLQPLRAILVGNWNFFLPHCT